MKSTVINISNENNNIVDILDETKKLSAYADLDKKQALRLRLLSEELVGMLSELSGNFEGQFWAQIEGRNVELITSIFVIDTMDTKTKKGFIDVSSRKKNAAAKGIMGKIRDVVENMMYPEDALYSANYISSDLGSDVMMGVESKKQSDDDLTVEELVDNIMLGDCWSLNQYKAKQSKNAEPWDEIEKSIIANIADDVTVSVKGKNVEIKVTKNFA